jgi:hypothetical protein
MMSVQLTLQRWQAYRHSGCSCGAARPTPQFVAVQSLLRGPCICLLLVQQEHTYHNAGRRPGAAATGAAQPAQSSLLYSTSVPHIAHERSCLCSWRRDVGRPAGAVATGAAQPARRGGAQQCKRNTTWHPLLCPCRLGGPFEGAGFGCQASAVLVKRRFHNVVFTHPILSFSMAVCETELVGNATGASGCS